jgi:hypothetical protein
MDQTKITVREQSLRYFFSCLTADILVFLNKQISEAWQFWQFWQFVAPPEFVATLEFVAPPELGPSRSLSFSAEILVMYQFERLRSKLTQIPTRFFHLGTK